MGSERNVRALRRREIFPPRTVFYEEPLTFADMPRFRSNARSARLARRSRWVQAAQNAVRKCDVILFAPDNGLEVGSTAAHHQRGPKFAFFDELSPFLESGQSLIIYQHIGHNRSAASQIQLRLDQLNQRLDGCDGPFAMFYHRGSLRALLVVPALAHRQIPLERAQRLIQGRWGQYRHFTLLLPGSASRRLTSEAPTLNGVPSCRQSPASGLLA